MITENNIKAATHQYLKNTVRSLSFDADAVHLANFVSNVNEAGSIGRAAMHYSCYHDLAGDLACFNGRPLLSTCKLIFFICEMRNVVPSFKKKQTNKRTNEKRRNKENSSRRRETIIRSRSSRLLSILKWCVPRLRFKRNSTMLENLSNFPR